MLEADLLSDMGVFGKPKPITQGHLRANNDAFWHELSQIAHTEPVRQEPIKPASLPTFELNDAMIEERVRKITAQQIARS